MVKDTRRCITLLACMLFFGCSGQSGGGSEKGALPPEEVSETDKSRYNLNEADESLINMQDSVTEDSLDTVAPMH